MIDWDAIPIHISDEDRKRLPIVAVIVAVAVTAGFAVMIFDGWMPSIFHHRTTPPTAVRGALVASLGLAVAAFYVGRRWPFETPCTYVLMAAVLSVACVAMLGDPFALLRSHIRIHRLHVGLYEGMRFMMPSVVGWASGALWRTLGTGSASSS